MTDSDTERICIAHDGPAADCLHIKHGEKHSCGYIEDTFACRIRHVGVSMPNSEARRHDARIRAERQEKIYGV